MKIDYAVVGVTMAASLVMVYVINHFFGNMLVKVDAVDKTKLGV